MKIDLFFDTQYGKFADAIHLPDDHGLTDEQIEAIKQQRLDNWIASITEPLSNYVLEADDNPVIAE